MKIINRLSYRSEIDKLMIESCLDIIKNKPMNIFYIHSDMNNFDTFKIEKNVFLNKLPQIGDKIINNKNKLFVFNVELIEQKDTNSLIIMCNYEKNN